MINNSRFILTLDGASTVSANNNNIIHVASNPPAIINLANLNTPTNSCEFDVYSINNNYTPDDPQTNYLCSNGDTDGDGNNTNLPYNFNTDNIFGFRDEFLFYMSNGIATKTNTTSTFVAAAGGGTGLNAAHCHFEITDHSCDEFSFDGDDPYYFQDANGDNIQNTSEIVFNCNDINTYINYKHENFDVSFENNCYNPSSKSYLVFTPKTGATGLQELGDGSFSNPFFINNVENQIGDFYLTPGCDASNELYTALNDVVLNFHTSN